MKKFGGWFEWSTWICFVIIGLLFWHYNDRLSILEHNNKSIVFNIQENGNKMEGEALPIHDPFAWSPQFHDKISQQLMVGAPTPVPGPPPLYIKLISMAGKDIPGVWDPTTRAHICEALSVNLTQVMADWYKSKRQVIVSTTHAAPWQLIVQNGPLAAGTGLHGPHWGRTSLMYAKSWQTLLLLLSHEGEEMLANPDLKQCLNGYALEIADAAVCCHQDLILADGTIAPVQTFVLPSYFAGGKAPYTEPVSQYITKPLQTPFGGWTTKCGDLETGAEH